MLLILFDIGRLRPKTLVQPIYYTVNSYFTYFKQGEVKASTPISLVKEFTMNTSYII